MSVEEREIMRQHIAYWSEYAKSGIAVIFGPVMDPASYVVTPMAAAVLGDAQTTLES